jgi:hypothetical protein
MTLNDVITFVAKNPGRNIQTIGERLTFTVQQRGNAFTFATRSGKTRNESYKWIHKSLNVLNETDSLAPADYTHTYNASYVLGLFREILAERNAKPTDQLPPPATNIGITEFFRNTLGANLSNTRWSWGAVDPISNRIFLRVWEDQIEALPSGERVEIYWPQQRSRSPGYEERLRQIAAIEAGAPAFGVVARAKNPDTPGTRDIESYQPTPLLRLGAITHEGGGIYARILERIPLHNLARVPTSHSTLVKDLKAIISRPLKATVKEALVQARIGQGKFRSAILSRWGNCCAVTASTTADAIRASHIKPWSKSTNTERLDPANGLPLIASLDALFDAGLISFYDSGQMLVSSKLTAKERAIYGIVDAALRNTPPPETIPYLKHHRENQFRA